MFRQKKKEVKMSRIARKAIRKAMRRIVKRAKAISKKRRIIRKGRYVKSINFARPRSGSIMLS